MLTLAVSGLFLVLAEKWRTVTQGNDGFTFKAPEFFKDRVMFYIVVLVILVLVYIFLRRFVNSPFGRVLVAVRENEQRTRSLRFNPLYYKVIASVVAGVIASLAGSLYAVSLRFVNTSGIDEAAVVGKKDEVWGEKVVAFVSLQDESTTTTDLILKHCKKTLASYKIPKEIVILPELPKTHVGKIDKNELLRLRD